jgi:hypothetical protein
MSNWSDATARLRQFSFSPAFRIGPDDDPGWLGDLDDIASEVASIRQPLGLARESPPPRADAQPTTNEVLPDRFVVGLCNELFRMQRNLKILRDDGRESKESRSIGRALENIQQILNESAVRCDDLAEEPCDEGRVDFEPISEAEIRPGLTRMTIIECVRPRVMRDGKLLQRASGLVARPPVEQPVSPERKGEDPSCPRIT